MNVIRFHRIGSDHWEIAFSEAHLYAKLDGDMAEVVMPEDAWWVRAWRWLRPPVGIEMKTTERD